MAGGFLRRCGTPGVFCVAGLFVIHGIWSGGAGANPDVWTRSAPPHTSSVVPPLPPLGAAWPRPARPSQPQQPKKKKVSVSVCPGSTLSLFHPRASFSLPDECPSPSLPLPDDCATPLSLQDKFINDNESESDGSEEEGSSSSSSSSSGSGSGSSSGSSVQAPVASPSVTGCEQA